MINFNQKKVYVIFKSNRIVNFNLRFKKSSLIKKNYLFLTLSTTPYL